MGNFDPPWTLLAVLTDMNKSTFDPNVAADAEFRERVLIFDRAQLTERWDRINSNVRFQDVIADLQEGECRELFGCPFHGPDSRPSFKVYVAENSGWCSGCPDGFRYYDSVRFVAAWRDCSNRLAIEWLEEKYGFPDLVSKPDDDIQISTLTFYDVVEPFLTRAAKLLRDNPDPEKARMYVQMFFNAIPVGEPDSRVELLRALPLAKVLGWAALTDIKTRKFGYHYTIRESEL